MVEYVGVEVLDILPFSQEDNNELLNIINGDAAVAGYEEVLFEAREVYDKYNFDANLNSFVSNIEECNLSHYIENDDFNCQLMLNHQRTLSIISHNIRSLPANIEEFLVDFSNLVCSPSVVAFTETRLSNDIEQLYSIPGFEAFYNSRNTSGGGVAIYVANGIVANLLLEATVLLPEIETVAISFTHEFKYYVLLNVYRPPRGCLRSFIVSLNEILVKIYYMSRCKTLSDGRF